MTRVLYRNVRATPGTAVGGDGIHLFDRDGRRYIDACCGVVVSSLGHNHPRVVEAIKRQADQLAYVHAGAFTNGPAEELAELLVERSPGLTHAYFLSGGSEIVELCLKTAYQYHVETGQPGRRTFISRRQSYHGSTLGTLAISGNLQRRDIFDPLLGPTHLVAPCYAYRDKREGESDREYGRRLAAELEEKILEIGPDQVAAFVAETVVGSTSGAVPPVEGYFAEIRAVCDRHGVLLILDEVMAGMGRTGHHYACAEDDVRPDILAVGKGLAAGYQPISAMLVAPHVHEAIRAGSGILKNGQTFVNHPLACATALEVQRTIVEDGLLGNVRQRGHQLRTRLTEVFAEQPHVGDVRGRGLFIGVEVVEDRSTKEPLATDFGFPARLRAEALREGLMTYPMSGTIDGRRGDHVLLAPPFICTADDVEAIVTRFAAAVDAVFREAS
ncbi:MAG TPA: aspartate aminotransferase family protein [Candidatus Dormibacteraeota bacterium]